MLLGMVKYRETIEAMIADAEVLPLPRRSGPAPVEPDIPAGDDADAMSDDNVDLPLPLAPIPPRRSSRLAALNRQ